MALAGDDHVVITIQAQLDGTPGLEGSDGRERGEQGRLRFLAAKTAAHAPAFDLHPVARAAERMRDDVLDFGRMLRRGQHAHLAFFFRKRKRDLAFEVEMVLPAAAGAPGDAMRCLANRFSGIALGQGARWRNERLLVERVLDAEDRRQHFILDAGTPGGAACSVVCFGEYQKNRLPLVLQQHLGQQRVIVNA